MWAKRVENFWMRCLDGGSNPPISTTKGMDLKQTIMRKVHLILLAFILTGCMNNSWWEPRTLITNDKNGQPLGRYQFTYDERGNKFTETGDIWDQTTATWIRDYRISYSYDIYGVRTGALKEKRDSLSAKWLPVSRVICNYSQETYRPETETHRFSSQTSNFGKIHSETTISMMPMVVCFILSVKNGITGNLTGI